jgi:hypothetical protein
MSAIDVPPPLNIACRLVVSGLSLQIGQICHNSLVVNDDVNVPPSDAELILQVKGKRKVFRIFLPHGIQKGVESTLFY